MWEKLVTVLNSQRWMFEEGLRGVVERMEAGLNVIVENTSGQFVVVPFFRPQIFLCGTGSLGGWAFSRKRC